MQQEIKNPLRTPKAVVTSTVIISAAQIGMLSEDDGETWPYTLLLDERNEVSYPDAKEADNGYIYVTYDWERVTQREILMARFTEDDILRGKILSPEGKLRVLVNKALGQPDIH